MKAFYNNQLASELSSPVKHGWCFPPSFPLFFFKLLLPVAQQQFVSDFSLTSDPTFLILPCLLSRLTSPSPLFFLSFNLCSSFLPPWQQSWISRSLSDTLQFLVSSNAGPRVSVSSSDLVWCVTGAREVRVWTSSRLWLCPCYMGGSRTLLDRPALTDCTLKHGNGFKCHTRTQSSWQCSRSGVSKIEQPGFSWSGWSLWVGMHKHYRCINTESSGEPFSPTLHLLTLTWF